MKRKFVKVMFFGALALSTVTYVGCKDYDDDINAINERIDANDAKLAEIQKVLDSGQWVKDVKPIANGIQVVLGNEKTYDITNGKDGVNGNDGIVYTIGTKVLRKLSGRLPEILLILKTVTGGLEIPI